MSTKQPGQSKAQRREAARLKAKELREAEAIKALEKNVEQLDTKIHATEKAIRNYENK